ncbi:MAG: hypothetical protein SFZ24_05405 [Planctomycetota bacterium]|nr:hypothetical protein [Planctomycetota bacterium]
MDASEPRRQRLETLLNLARVARGWSRAQLARSLDRDPTKLVPESANPKMDYLVRLAEVLEWPVGEVIDAIWSGGTTTQPGAPSASFEECNTQIADAVRAADYKKVVEISQHMYAVARSADERAHACIREAAGWDGMGRYPKVLEAARRGLQQGALSVRLRLVLQATLANAQYTLWDLTPALGTCEVLARWYESNPPAKRHDWKRVAYVYYVRGNTHRRLMALEPENHDAHAASAKADLTKAADLYASLARELADDGLNGVANTCKGGLIEVGVEMGERDPREAAREMLARLETCDPLGKGATGDWVESYGWWCIFGSNIALRHLRGRELQQSMSVFTSKALAIADRLDNWAMRERVFTIQFALHNLMVDATGLDLAFTIDDQERSLISATMGRFPTFRSTGWKILETARVVQGAKESNGWAAT